MSKSLATILVIGLILTTQVEARRGPVRIAAAGEVEQKQDAPIANEDSQVADVAEDAASAVPSCKAEGMGQLKLELAGVDVSAEAKVCLLAVHDELKSIKDAAKKCAADVLATNQIDLQGKTRSEIKALLTDAVKAELADCKKTLPSREEIKSEVQACIAADQ